MALLTPTLAVLACHGLAHFSLGDPPQHVLRLVARDTKHERRGWPLAGERRVEDGRHAFSTRGGAAVARAKPGFGDGVSNENEAATFAALVGARVADKRRLVRGPLSALIGAPRAPRSARARDVRRLLDRHRRLSRLVEECIADEDSKGRSRSHCASWSWPRTQVFEAGNGAAAGCSPFHRYQLLYLGRARSKRFLLARRPGTAIGSSHVIVGHNIT